jgi:hypothetical protein
MPRKRAPEGPSLFGEDEIADMPAKVVTDAQAIWNEYAEKYKWGRCTVLDKARRASIARAVQDYGGLVGFRSNLDKITRNRFLMGRVPPRTGFKQFRATIDWFIQASTVRKVIEDFYEADYFPQAVQSLSAQIKPSDEWGRWLRDYKLKGFWPTTMGPRPEDPACRAPAAALEACRQRLGIVVTVPITESREDRLRATIVSYRKVGRYEDANRIERQLAMAESRAPVEVPSPEVAKAGSENDDRAWLGLSRRPERRRADVVSDRMKAKVTDLEPPEYDAVPEGDFEVEEP